MIEHERISRIKHAKAQVPTESIALCLRHANVAARDIDAIAFGWDASVIDLYRSDDPRWAIENVLPAAFSQLPRMPPVVGVPHHRAHAASAFWCSGFEEAAVLVADGQGEEESSSLWFGSRDGLTKLREYPGALSLGHFYRAATVYAGLDNEDLGGNEGKLMGLAAYGKPDQAMPLRVAASGLVLERGLEPDGGFNLRRSLKRNLLNWWERHSFPYVCGDGGEVTAYVDFAASAQRALEECLGYFAHELKKLTGSSNFRGHDIEVKGRR